jgi:hypothetical protein
MPKTPKLIATALSLLLVGTGISIAAPAQADTDPTPTRAWDDSYYYESYTCAPLVVLAFRGSDEHNNIDPRDYNVIPSKPGPVFNTATQLESIRPLNYGTESVEAAGGADYDPDVINGTGPRVYSDTRGYETESTNFYKALSGKYDNTPWGEAHPLDQNFEKKWPDMQRATDIITTNGWEGPRIYGLLQAWASSRYALTGIGQPLPIIGIGTATNGARDGYDAVSVSGGVRSAGQSTIDSAIKGAEAATAYIQQVQNHYANCEQPPKFMVIGYSQGAIAARLTAITNPTEVVASFLLGDPFLVSNNRSQYGNIIQHGGAALTGTGMLVPKGSSLSMVLYPEDNPHNITTAVELDKYNSIPERVNWCHNNDIFCDFQWLYSIADLTQAGREHTSYFSKQPETGGELGPYSEVANAGDNLATAISCIQEMVLDADTCEVSWQNPAAIYTDTPEKNPVTTCKATGYNGYTTSCTEHTFGGASAYSAKMKAAASKQAQVKVLAKKVRQAVKAKPKASVSISLPGKKTQFVIPKAKGATYRYDLDGNGKYELKSKRNTATHVYKQPGTTKVHVQVNYGKRGKSVKKYTLTVNTQAIAPSTAALWYDPSHNLDKATLTPIKGAVKLHITGLPKNGEYGLRIVKSTKDPLTVKPTRIYGPYKANAKGEANVKLITKALAKGTYQAVIVSPDGFHRTFTTVKIQ